jgi:hypothetical protein
MLFPRVTSLKHHLVVGGCARLFSGLPRLREQLAGLRVILESDGFFKIRHGFLKALCIQRTFAVVPQLLESLVTSGVLDRWVADLLAASPGQQCGKRQHCHEYALYHGRPFSR